MNQQEGSDFKVGAVNFEVTVRPVWGDVEWAIKCKGLEGGGEFSWDSSVSHYT